MERLRNEIWFEHAKRAPRTVKFVAYGKGLHAAGGVWGEDDWFELLEPDARLAVDAVKAKIDDYLKLGFRIAKSRILSETLAKAFGLPHDAPAPGKKKTARAKPA